jgi:carbon starvation protein
MFGTANQLLASVALAAATSAIINSGRAKYAWATFLPMLFVAVTTLSACWLNIFNNFLPMAADPSKAFQAYLNTALTAVIMVCAAVVLWESFARWHKVLVLKKHPKAIRDVSHEGHELPEYGCC